MKDGDGRAITVGVETLKSKLRDVDTKLYTVLLQDEALITTRF